MRIRALVVSGIVAVALIASAIASPAQAERKLKGSLTSPQVPAWLGAGGGRHGMGSDTVTAAAFANACRQDREAHAAGNPKAATHIAAFLASKQNGVDAYVFDLGKETQGAFAAEGPGAIDLGGVTGHYDLDLDFFTGAEVDAKGYDPTGPGGFGCPNANRVGSSHKCYGHKGDAHEKVGCVAGYKDSKKVMHFARYAMISGSLNLNGPMPLTLTAP